MNQVIQDTVKNAAIFNVLAGVIFFSVSTIADQLVNLFAQDFAPVGPESIMWLSILAASISFVASALAPLVHGTGNEVIYRVAWVAVIVSFVMLKNDVPSGSPYYVIVGIMTLSAAVMFVSAIMKTEQKYTDGLLAEQQEEQIAGDVERKWSGEPRRETPSERVMRDASDEYYRRKGSASPQPPQYRRSH